MLAFPFKSPIMNKSLTLALFILVVSTGCSSDTKTSDQGTNNSVNTQTNNASNNNAANNTSGENNETLGTWTAEFDGTSFDGISVQPFYSESNDMLSIALQGGPDDFTTLSIEIDGVGYGATGTFSAATHEMRVTAGGTGFTCFSGDTSTFAVTFEEISCSSLAVCAAKGTFSGTLDCNARGVVQLDGSFLR